MHLSMLPPLCGVRYAAPRRRPKLTNPRHTRCPCCPLCLGGTNAHESRVGAKRVLQVPLDRAPVTPVYFNQRRCVVPRVALQELLQYFLPQPVVILVLVWPEELLQLR
jgi:hypothetical protein